MARPRARRSASTEILRCFLVVVSLTGVTSWILDPSSAPAGRRPSARSLLSQLRAMQTRRPTEPDRHPRVSVKDVGQDSSAEWKDAPYGDAFRNWIPAEFERRPSSHGAADREPSELVDYDSLTSQHNNDNNNNNNNDDDDDGNDNVGGRTGANSGHSSPSAAAAAALIHPKRSSVSWLLATTLRMCRANPNQCFKPRTARQPSAAGAGADDGRTVGAERSSFRGDRLALLPDADG